MTLKEIMNLTTRQINSKSEKELKKITKTLVDVANKRIKRVEATGVGYASSALNARRYGKGSSKVKPFSAKLPKRLYRNKSEMGKEIDSERREKAYEAKIAELKNFLNSFTSTAKGTKEVAKQLGATFGLDYDKLSLDQQRRFWEAYNKFKRDNPTLIRAMGKNAYMKARGDLFSMMVKKTKGEKFRVSTKIDDMAEQMKAKFEEAYQIKARTLEDDSPLSTITKVSSENEGTSFPWQPREKFERQQILPRTGRGKGKK